MIKTSTPTFGPGGNSDAFRLAGKKSTVEAPEWIRSIGLDAYEFEAGKIGLRWIIKYYFAWLKYKFTRMK